MSESTITCSCCGAAVPPDDIVYVGDQPVCTDCAEDETFVCDHCGFRFWNDENAGGSRFNLCESCRDEYYVACSECGRLLHNSEAYYADSDEEGEVPCCESCYQRKVGGALHSYSYKPAPVFYGGGPLYLGVELEVDGAGKSASNARAILNVMNRRAEYVYIKTDGSLDDGLEVVTHPCTLEEHLKYLPWKDGIDAIRSMHYCSHNAGTCGLHVHVNRDGLGHSCAAQDETIGKILYLFERFWQEVLRFSRRTESQMNHWAARYGYKNSGKEILDHAKYDSGNGRYACINLTNYDTIEFRAFRGTLKYNTLIATLQFVERICKVALSLSEEEIQSLGWPQLVLQIADESAPELIQYLKERRLYINEPVVTTEREV